MLFTWTCEFGVFHEKVPKYEAEARLRKIFTAPNNEYPLIEHQVYRKFLQFDGEAYTPWPKSYNDSNMIYDLIALRQRREGDYNYYTAIANEYGFHVDGIGSFELGENEKFLINQAKTWRLDYNAALLTNCKYIEK